MDHAAFLQSTLVPDHYADVSTELLRLKCLSPSFGGSSRPARHHRLSGSDLGESYRCVQHLSDGNCLFKQEGPGEVRVLKLRSCCDISCSTLMMSRL